MGTGHERPTQLLSCVLLLLEGLLSSVVVAYILNLTIRCKQAVISQQRPRPSLRGSIVLTNSNNTNRDSSINNKNNSNNNHQRKSRFISIIGSLFSTTTTTTTINKRIIPANANRLKCLLWFGYSPLTSVEYTSNLTVSAVSSCLATLICNVIYNVYRLHLTMEGWSWRQIEESRMRLLFFMPTVMMVGVSWILMTLVQLERLILTFAQTTQSLPDWTSNVLYLGLLTGLSLGIPAILSRNAVIWRVTIFLFIFGYLSLNAWLLYSFSMRTLKIARQLNNHIDCELNIYHNKKSPEPSVAELESTIEDIHYNDDHISNDDGQITNVKNLNLPPSLSPTNSSNNKNNNDSTGMMMKSIVMVNGSSSLKKKTRRDSQKMTTHLQNVYSDSSIGADNYMNDHHPHSEEMIMSRRHPSKTIVNAMLVDVATRITICVTLSIISSVADSLITLFNIFLGGHNLPLDIWFHIRTLALCLDLMINAFGLLCTFSSASRYYRWMFGSLNDWYRKLLS